MHFNPERQRGPSFADVKQRANGRWPDILATLGVPVSANGIETDAADVHKAQRQQRGPTGKNQRRVWDALIGLEATATKSPGVMGIPEGALIVKEDDLLHAYCETADGDEPEKRLRASFARVLTALEHTHPSWIKKKGGNVWRA